jgi:hypothetical protein
MYAVVCADTLVLDDIPIIDKIIGNTNDIFVSTAMILRTGAFSFALQDAHVFNTAVFNY